MGEMEFRKRDFLRSISSNYIAVDADALLVDASSGAITITLPEVTLAASLILKKTDSSVNTVKVATPGSETIDGAASLIISSRNELYSLISDGVNWYSTSSAVPLAPTEGTSNFAGPGGVTISHSLNLANYNVSVEPSVDGGGAIGEIWVTDIAINSFVVRNSGAGVTAFSWTIRNRASDTYVRFGLVNSIEYGHQSLEKIDNAVLDFNGWNPDFVIELGDFIGHSSSFANKAAALIGLDEVEASYANLTMSRKYAFGNHCLDWLLKSDYFGHTNMDSRYYSFDFANFHFIVLDGMFKSNGDDWEGCIQDIEQECPYSSTIYVSDAEKTWLENDLKATAKKTIVFMEAAFEGGYSVANASEVRTILETSGKVIATFSGNAGSNAKTTINGIDHYKMGSMDESSPTAYAKISVYPSNTIRIEGVGKQTSYQ